MGDEPGCERGTVCARRHQVAGRDGENPIEELVDGCTWPISGPRWWPREVPAPRSDFQL
jgi:hypothetical protein